jgi:hypothetical protein
VPSEASGHAQGWQFQLDPTLPLTILPANILSKKPKRRSTPANTGGSGDSSHSASGQPESKPAKWPARWRVPGLILLYLLLAFNFMRLPKTAADQKHDLGSQMSFEFYARAKYQFGLDVIQNVGPYGYLQYPNAYSGILPTQKLVFGIMFGLVVAWFALEARRYFATRAGQVTWFLGLFFAMVMPSEELDMVTDIFIFLAAHHLLISARKGALKFIMDAVLSVFLGLLFLLKSTNVLLIGLLLALVVVERIRTRRFLDLAWNLGCVGITALALWIHAGQKVSNAASFMRGAMAFSKGYNEALSTIGKPQMVWLGLIVLALFAAINLLRVWQFRAYWHRLTTSVFEAACLFIIWKHAYVRAGHEVFLWSTMIPASPLLFLAHERPSAAGNSQRPAQSVRGWLGGLHFNLYRLAAVSVAVTVICSICACRVEKDNQSYSGYASLWAAIGSPFNRICANFWELADWSDHLKALKAKLELNRADAALPEVKKAIGDATIDDFGFYPGLMLLNDFHYTPRPMPINFAATTEMLMQRNAEFYRNDATAPAYLLADIGQIDGRLAPQDDALALLEVLTRYQPLLVDHNHILLKRVSGRPDLERVPLNTQTVAWGEGVTLPDTAGKMLWCVADIQYSLFGRARSFFLHPPPAYIVFESSGLRFGPVRVLPSGTRTGFLLRPLIINPVDFLAAYGIRVQSASGATPEFDTIRFVTQDQDHDCFQPEIKLSFSTVELQK